MCVRGWHSCPGGAGAPPRRSIHAQDLSHPAPLNRLPSERTWRGDSMTHTARHKVLILGGGYAGMIAAARAARDSAADVTLIDARPAFFQRIRFHEMLAGGSPKTLDYAPLLGRRGVRFVQARVEGLEPGRQRVSARSEDGTPIELGYDTLILALGSVTGPGVPGAAEHAVRLDDPVAIREAAARLRVLAGSGGRVLVVGGGLTGIEAATELAER